MGHLLVQVLRAHHSTMDSLAASTAIALLEQCLEGDDTHSDRCVLTLSRCQKFWLHAQDLGRSLGYLRLAVQAAAHVLRVIVPHLPSAYLCSSAEVVCSSVMDMLSSSQHPLLKTLAEPCLKAILAGAAHFKVHKVDFASHLHAFTALA